MADDFSNLRNPKKPLFHITENIIDLKQTNRQKPNNRIRFIITKNKNNSWVDDLHAQALLNQIERVYH
jgi:hypothetical protein